MYNRVLSVILIRVHHQVPTSPRSSRCPPPGSRRATTRLLVLAPPLTLPLHLPLAALHAPASPRTRLTLHRITRHARPSWPLPSRASSTARLQLARLDQVVCVQLLQSLRAHFLLLFSCRIYIIDWSLFNLNTSILLTNTNSPFFIFVFTTCFPNSHRRPLYDVQSCRKCIVYRVAKKSGR